MNVPVDVLKATTLAGVITGEIANEYVIGQ